MTRESERTRMAKRRKVALAGLEWGCVYYRYIIIILLLLLYIL
jgi:hypothetical protein